MSYRRGKLIKLKKKRIKVKKKLSKKNDKGLFLKKFSQYINISKDKNEFKI